MSATSRPARFDIDADLVARCIDEMAQYGAHPVSGMQRLVYTPAWRESVAHYVRWLEHDGLHVRQDAVGNVFGVAPGRENTGGGAFKEPDAGVGSAAAPRLHRPGLPESRASPPAQRRHRACL